MHGLATSDIEISFIPKKGFWILLENEELFVPYSEFAWFKQATVDELTTVESPSPDHLYLPLLDVDLTVDSIRNPSLYPMVLWTGVEISSVSPAHRGRYSAMLKKACAFAQ